MSNIFGNVFKICIFGESHSSAIGIVIDGIPPGFHIDIDLIKLALQRRAPNNSNASTPRSESDMPEILCGFINGKTTGTPLCAIIRNHDARSSDYNQILSKIRPGHADYTGYIKYRAANDIRGGGHFSGRITAPIVFAGAIAEQFLNFNNIYIGAHIIKLGSVSDAPFKSFTRECFNEALNSKMFVINAKSRKAMENEINLAAKEKDSLGGIIECGICGIPVGIGEPFFDSIESCIAHILFSIPAVKGVEFGAGFSIANMRGSESNDIPLIKDGEVVFKTNNNGGINGGITNGMPVIFKVAIKPTPSIAKSQDTIDIKKMENSTLEIKGRHDVCILPRAVEVVRAAASIVIMDLFLQRNCQ